MSSCWPELEIDMHTNWNQTNRESQITFVNCNIWDLHQNQMIDTQNTEFV